MPYIKPEARPPFDEVLDKLPPIETPDDAEYVLCAVLDQFLPHRMPDPRPQFDEVLDHLPVMPTSGTLGYVVAVVMDKFLMAMAAKDTQGQLRFQYQGQAFGIFMRQLLDYWSQGDRGDDAKARDLCGLLTSILFDYFHCVNEPYENDVRARAGEVWQAAHRLPGHAGHPV